MFKQRIGMGRMTMDDPGDYFTPDKLLLSSSGTAGDYSEKATIAVCDLGPRPRDSEIVVHGTITASEGTSISALKAYIAR